MSLFTRSFRRETKHLPQCRPSILRPSLETFKINSKSLRYSFHGPSASSIFIMKLCWQSNQSEVRWGGGGGWCGCIVWVLPLALLATPHLDWLLASAQSTAIKPACCLADISLCALCSNNPPQGQIRFIWEGKSARGFRMTMLIRNQNINSNSTWMY